MPLLKIDAWTIVFQVANFAILATVLYFVLFRPALRRMKAQKTEKEAVAREMAQNRQEAERLRSVLEDRLAGVEQEATAIIARAREQTEVERAELLDEAQVEAERLLVEAHANANRLQGQAAEELADETLDTVLAISAQIIG